MRDAEQRELVQRIQSGDSAAEDKLFKRYKTLILWKISRAIKSDPENLKDLACEVYIAILQELRKETFEPGNWQTLDQFVLGVTRNKIRDWFKKDKRESALFVSDSVCREVGAAVETYLLEEQEMRRFLTNFLEKLEPKYRKVLELRYFQELSVQEIGRKLGMPPQRVSERIHYAVKLIRKECRKRKIFSIYGVFILLYICSSQVGL